MAACRWPKPPSLTCSASELVRFPDLIVVVDTPQRWSLDSLHVMNNFMLTPHFSFTDREISTRFSEQVTEDNLFSRPVAEPLFSADCCMAGITERPIYDSGPATVRTRHVGTPPLKYSQAQAKRVRL